MYSSAAVTIRRAQTGPMEDPVKQFLAKRGAAPHLIAGGAPGLVQRWREFVSLVQAGYALGLEDYRNDLDLRTLIALAGIAPDVAEDDARLLALLTRTDLEIWSSDAEDAWWTRGYPSNAGPVLLEDLRAEGIL